MKICAIIAEFNPFHNGHKYLIDKIREKGFTHIIAVISGNFVQRGEPSIISKQSRIKSALSLGVDLVAEIPVVWSLSSAERYARAGIEIIKSFGCVDAIAFGSECGNINAMKEIVTALKTDKFKLLLKENLDNGVTFAKACKMAINSIMNAEVSNFLNFPNNILGIEYLKSIEDFNVNVEPITIKRIGKNNECKYCSASEIRRMIINSDESFKNYVPQFSFEILKKETIHNLEFAQQSFIYKLRNLSREDILKLPDVSEGLENRILESVRRENNLNSILFSIKTKRYTMARIKRILMCGFLDIKSEIQTHSVPYIRLLGSNSKGYEILKKSKKTALLPLVSRYSEIKKLSSFAIEVFNCECKSSDCYCFFSKKIESCGQEQAFRMITC